MVGVDKIQDIRTMWRRGRSVAEIARVVGVSEPTVRKYRDMEDLSLKPPKKTSSESEVLAPYASTIDRWLSDDAKYWRKQRHTAVRVYVRLRDEKGYAGSYSNVGLTQVFWGETAERVCEGLKNVFGFVGGVPARAVFDNATEIGRKVSGEVRASELFRLFAAHCGLDHTFTNPHSGNEKGNVLYAA